MSIGNYVFLAVIGAVFAFQVITYDGKGSDPDYRPTYDETRRLSR